MDMTLAMNKTRHLSRRVFWKINLAGFLDEYSKGSRDNCRVASTKIWTVCTAKRKQLIGWRLLMVYFCRSSSVHKEDAILQVSRRSLRSGGADGSHDANYAGRAALIGRLRYRDATPSLPGASTS
eukprot:6179368-Pleurochrysis_carterae.AAC.1